MLNILTNIKLSIFFHVYYKKQLREPTKYQRSFKQNYILFTKKLQAIFKLKQFSIFVFFQEYESSSSPIFSSVRVLH